MADDAIRKELDAIKADLAQLREDIAGLTDAVKGTATENVRNARAQAEDRVRGAWEEIEQRLEDVLNEGRATFDKAERKVGEHPGGSVLTAFGLGFIIAKLLSIGERH